MKYTRTCAQCRNPIHYLNKHTRDRAEKCKRGCRSCSYEKSSKTQKKIFSFERVCPKCSRQLTYSSYFSWWSANKHSRVCASCSKKGVSKSAEFKSILSKAMSGKGNPMYGRKHTKEVKDFISQNNRQNKSKTGQRCDKNTKKNMRIAALNRIDNLGAVPSYNPTACTYMDSFRPKYNFQHALNGGELRVCGYSVDGYDKENNVVFEYDEPHHFEKKTWTLKQRDVQRMDEIKNEIGCRFIRYDERKKLLTEH